MSKPNYLNYLQKQLDEDYELLKPYKDELHIEPKPSIGLRLTKEINKLKQTIKNHE